MRRVLAPLALGWLLGGCHSAAGAPEAPAQRIVPDERSDQELRQLISAALYAPLHTPVRIAPDAFGESSLLTIERQRHTAPDGTRVMGRELGTPHRFRLLIRQDQCVLEHVGPGTRWTLKHTACRPAAD